jgi:hypothetical protein
MVDVDEDFKDALEEQTPPSIDTLDGSDVDDDDSEASEGRRYFGAGLLLRVAAAGIVSLIKPLTRLGRPDDDLGGVLVEAADVDDLNTALALGSHANKASVQSAGNAFVAPNVPSSTPLAPPPGVESAA